MDVATFGGPSPLALHWEVQLDSLVVRGKETAHGKGNGGACQLLEGRRNEREGHSYVAGEELKQP